MFDMRMRRSDMNGNADNLKRDITRHLELLNESKLKIVYQFVLHLIK